MLLGNASGGAFLIVDEYNIFAGVDAIGYLLLELAAVTSFADCIGLHRLCCSVIYHQSEYNIS